MLRPGDLGRQKEHLQTRDPNGMIDTLPRNRLDGLVLLPLGDGEQFHPAPEIVRKYYPLKEGMVAPKTFGRNCQQPFVLGFLDGIFHIGPTVIAGNDRRGPPLQTSGKDPVQILVSFLQLQLPVPAVFFPNPHDHEPFILRPSRRLVETLVIFLKSMPIPAAWSKVGSGALIPENVIVATLPAGLNRLGADEFRVPTTLRRRCTRPSTISYSELSWVMTLNPR